MPKKPASELTAVDLVSLFKTFFGGNVVLGRDARLFREFMDNEGLEPTQVLLGFYHLHTKPMSYVSEFLRHSETWMIRDRLEAEALLAARLCPNLRLPGCYWAYMDLRQEDWLHAGAVVGLERAKEELQTWIAEKLQEYPLQVGRGGM